MGRGTAEIVEDIEFKKAGIEDTLLIEELAQEIFRATYKEMLSPGQIEYMMDWMYSQENLHKQILEDGHIYHIVYDKNKHYYSYLRRNKADDREKKNPLYQTKMIIFDLHSMVFQENSFSFLRFFP